MQYVVRAGEQIGHELLGTLSAACAAGGAAINNPATKAMAVEPVTNIFFTAPPSNIDLRLHHR